MAELQAQAPGFPWAAYFPAAGVERSDRVVVSQITAIPKLAQIFADADLQTLTAWQMFHTPADPPAPRVEARDRLVVSQIPAIPKLAQIFADADLQTLKAWQMFHTADDMAPFLSKRFVDANFEFRSRLLPGQPQQ